jgi:DNA-binding beta-propeller fold protein YncE
MSIVSKPAKTSIGLTLLAVCFTVRVPWMSGQDSSPEALAKGGRTGPNSGLNSQVLNYKLVPWPLEAKSAAGFDAGPWNFIQVASVATHPNGNILVLHRGAHPLMEFEPSGKFIRTWDNIPFSEGKVVAIPEKDRGNGPSFTAVYGPAGCDSCGAHTVRVDPEQNIWLIDAPGHVVYKTNMQGNVLLQLGTKGMPGSDTQHFNLPTDVGFAPNGDFYISDGYGGARVVKFSKDGKFLLEFGKRGNGPGEFALPHNVVVDAQGRVYVSDRENQRVEVFDAVGKFLSQWAGTGRYSAMAITKDQKIWTGSVLRELDGTVIGRLPEGVGAHGGIAIHPSGDIYLAQLGGVVQKFAKQ